MFDSQTVRVARRNNRIPNAVLTLEARSGRRRARTARRLPLDAGPRCRHRPARLRARRSAPARHLRPRPADSRTHNRARQGARQRASVDGAAAGGNRPDPTLAKPLHAPAAAAARYVDWLITQATWAKSLHERTPHRRSNHQTESSRRPTCPSRGGNHRWAGTSPRSAARAITTATPGQDLRPASRVPDASVKRADVHGPAYLSSLSGIRFDGQ